MNQNRDALSDLEQSLASIRWLKNGITELGTLESGLLPLWNRVKELEQALEPYNHLHEQMESLWQTVQELKVKMAPMQALQGQLTTTREEIRKIVRASLQV